MPPRTRWAAIALVPRGDAFLAIAASFDPRDVNPPYEEGALGDASPEATLRRMLAEQTGVRVLDARLMRTLQIQGCAVHAYFVASWTGHARTTAAGKTHWALPERLIDSSCRHREISLQLLQQLRRVPSELQPR